MIKFAGDIKESRIISRYDLGKKPNGKWQNKLGRDILFIERNLDFLKPGGRMAIVLPQGRFNNSSDKQIRDYIAEKCRILAVGDLKSFGAYSLCNSIEYIDEGIPFLRCVNIKEYQVDFVNVLQINSNSHELLWKSEVKPNMILLTMSGSTGRVAIAQESWKYPINSNQDIAKIVCSDNINPYYLYIYLSTRHGTNQIYRQLAGSVQQHIYLWQIEKLLVFEANKTFQNFIELVAKLSYFYLEQSKNIYQQAKEY